MSDEIDHLKLIYDRFNARDMEAVLAALHEDVTWANGMEGGHVHGREGVRSYWTRQWAMINPRVEPVGFSTTPHWGNRHRSPPDCGDLEGNLVVDQMVGHIFSDRRASDHEHSAQLAEAFSGSANA
jgi:hypothetical protein